MKSIIVSVAVAAGLMMAGSAMAAPAMPKEGGRCAACHKIEGPGGMGPEWKQVSAKYKGKADAEKTLIANITKGGKFGWNKAIAMPAKGGGASEAEIATLAKFILTL
jgi:cytochrome c